MKEQAMKTVTEFNGMPMDPESKARRLERFVGAVAADDAEMVTFWRQRSAAEHAAAGAQVSDAAAQMAVQTGMGKDPTEMFPGLAFFLRRRS